MPDDVEGLLEDLTNAYGPTGHEGPVRSVVQQALEPIADSLETDGLGSLITRLTGASESPRVMLAAHMDEVGLMVRYVTPEGFIKFQTLGGWLDQALVNQRWVVLASQGLVPGLTGIKTVHVMQPDARTKVFKKEDLFIDVGATSKEDAEERLGIRPGDPIVPDSRFTPLSGGDLYLAKAWDDRAGLGVIIEVMRALKAAGGFPNTVYGVATVQEEVGLRGAQTSSHRVAPDVGINIESGVAGDYPDISPDEAQEKLGEGPTVFLHDASMLPNLKLRDLFVQVAKEEEIPVQFNVLGGYGQDGAQMQRSQSGTPAINIAVPTRYLHSHNGVINRQDFLNAIRLVTAVVHRLDADTVTELSRFD